MRPRRPTTVRAIVQARPTRGARRRTDRDRRCCTAGSRGRGRRRVASATPALRARLPWRAFRIPAPTSPHVTRPRSVARPASTELKPSGSGPSSSRPSSSIAAIASAAACALPRKRVNPGPGEEKPGVLTQPLARKPLEPRENRGVPIDVHVRRPTRPRSGRPPRRTHRPRPHARSPRSPSHGPCARRMRDGGASARGRGSRCSSSTRSSCAKRWWKRYHSPRSSSGRRNRFVRESAASSLSEPSCSSTASHNEPHSRSSTEARSIRDCVSGSCAPSTSSTRKSTT